MTEPSEEVKAMARRVADETIPEDLDAYETHEARMADWYVARDAALAAILETQRLDAEMAEDRYLETDWQEPGQIIADQIRTGNHYAKDHSNDR